MSAATKALELGQASPHLRPSSSVSHQTAGALRGVLLGKVRDPSRRLLLAGCAVRQTAARSRSTARR